MGVNREWCGRPLPGNRIESEADRVARREKLDQENKKRARRNAKSKALLVARELRVDRLLTLTIRLFDGVPLPYDKALTAFINWRQAVRRKYPDFVYLAIPETQKNGQYHWHIATRGYWDVVELGTMWRKALNRVMGRPVHLLDGEDSPGTVNVSARGQYRESAFRAKAICAYMVKYMTKDFEVEKFRKSFYHSVVKLAKPTSAWMRSESVAGAIVEHLSARGLWDAENHCSVSGVHVGMRRCSITGDVMQAWITYPYYLVSAPF